MKLNKPFIGNIQQITLHNNVWRRVLFTGANIQLVVMCLPTLSETDMEVHNDHDQFIRIEYGACLVQLDNKMYKLKRGDAVVVPAGTPHNLINPSRKKQLQIYTIYSPPEHPEGLVQDTK